MMDAVIWDWDLEEIYHDIEDSYDELFSRHLAKDSLVTDYDLIVFRVGVNICRGVLFDIQERRKMNE